MASDFSLTAELRLRAATGQGRKVVRDLNRQLQGQNITLRGGTQAKREGEKAARGAKKFNDQAKRATKTAKDMSQQFNTLANDAELFGKQTALATRRIAAFVIGARTLLALGNAFREGIKDAISFQREMVRVAQVMGTPVSATNQLRKTIGDLSTSLGVSSERLANVSTVLAQTGLRAREVEEALSVLAKTELAPTFGDIDKTAEGLVAIFRQFGRETNQLESDFSKINAIAANFAVESQDIIQVFKRAGGVFSAAGGDLDELAALFTSVRATTREDARRIATGFRTIFARIQRPSTIAFLEDLGIQLRDTNGQFVGGFEAIRRLNQALGQLETTGPVFPQVAEQLGGLRRLSQVIPLIQQFGDAQRALAIAQRGQSSLQESNIKAQEAFATQLEKTRQRFERFVRSLTETETFRRVIDSVLALSNALIGLGDSLVQILPLLAGIATVRLGPALFGFGRGVGTVVGPNFRRRLPFSTFGKDLERKQLFQGQSVPFQGGGSVPGSGRGDRVPALLEPKEFVLQRSAVDAIGVNNLKRLNQVQGFQKGGFVRPRNVPRENMLAGQNIPSDLRDLVALGPGLMTQTTSSSGLNTFLGQRFVRTRSGKIRQRFSKSTVRSRERQVAQIRRELVRSPRDLRLFSGIGTKELEEIESQIGLPITSKRSIGKTFSLKRFLNTSLEQRIAKQFGEGQRRAILNVVNPKGSKIGVIGGSEKEILLPNNSQFRILDIGQEGFGGSSKNIIKAIRTFQGGGKVQGSGRGDKIPALLEPKEFVLQRKAVEAIGVDNLRRLNQVQKFQGGGVVGGSQFTVGATGANIPTFLANAFNNFATQIQTALPLGGRRGPAPRNIRGPRGRFLPFQQRLETTQTQFFPPSVGFGGFTTSVGPPRRGSSVVETRPPGVIPRIARQPGGGNFAIRSLGVDRGLDISPSRGGFLGFDEFGNPIRRGQASPSGFVTGPSRNIQEKNRILQSRQQLGKKLLNSEQVALQLQEKTNAAQEIRLFKLLAVSSVLTSTIGQMEAFNDTTKQAIQALSGAVLQFAVLSSILPRRQPRFGPQIPDFGGGGRRGRFTLGRARRRIGVGLGRLRQRGLTQNQVLGGAALGIAGGGFLQNIGQQRIQEEQTGGRAISAFGQAATFAGIGAVIGSQIPVIGTAFGAVAGASIGLVKGLKDAQNQLERVQFAKKFDEFGRLLEGVSNERLGALQNATKIETKIRETNNRLIEADAESRAKLTAEVERELPAIENFLKALADDVSTFEEFRRRGDEAIRFFAQFSGLPFQEALNSFKSEFEARKKSAEIARRVNDANAKMAQEIRNTTEVISAIQDVEFFGRGRRAGEAQLAEVAGGGVGSIRSIQTSDIFSRVGELGNVGRFNQFVQNVGNLFGPAGNSLANQAQDAAQALNVLPDIIFDLRGRRTVEQPFKVIEEQLKQAGVGRSIRQEVSTLAEGIGDTTEFLQKLSTDPEEVISQLSKGLGEQADVLESATSIIDKELNRLGSLLNQRVQIESNITAGLNKEVAIRQEAIRILSEARGTRPSFGQLQRLDRQQLGNILRGIDVGRTPRALGRALEEIRTARGSQANEAQLRGRFRLANRLQNAQSEQLVKVNQLTQALEFLADISNRTAVVQQRLNSLREDREARAQLQIEELFGTREDRRAIERGRAGARELATAQDPRRALAGFTPRQREETLRILQQFRGTGNRIAGKRVDEILSSLGVEALPGKEEREQIAKLEEFSNTAIKAQQELNKNLQNRNQEFIRNLNNSFRDFLNRLFGAITQQRREQLVRQRENIQRRIGEIRAQRPRAVQQLRRFGVQDITSFVTGNVETDLQNVIEARRRLGQLRLGRTLFGQPFTIKRLQNLGVNQQTGVQGFLGSERFQQAIDKLGLSQDVVAQAQQKFGDIEGLNRVSVAVLNKVIRETIGQRTREQRKTERTNLNQALQRISEQGITPEQRERLIKNIDAVKGATSTIKKFGEEGNEVNQRLNDMRQNLQRVNEQLQSFGGQGNGMANFGASVEKFAQSTAQIPDTINLQGRQTVEVVFNGASTLANEMQNQLRDTFTEVARSEANKAVNNLREQLRAGDVS